MLIWLSFYSNWIGAKKGLVNSDRSISEPVCQQVKLFLETIGIDNVIQCANFAYAGLQTILLYVNVEIETCYLPKVQEFNAKRRNTPNNYLASRWAPKCKEKEREEQNMYQYFW